MPSSFLRCALSPFLCCFGTQSDPHEEPVASDLQTLPSALHLPATQIPHATGQPSSDRTDTNALRDLFRSSSSIRGYRTASIPSGSHIQRERSFDSDFKFGSQDPQPKQPSRLEQLGNHIKQKLSESGLSRSGSRPRLAPEENRNAVAQNVDTQKDNSHLPMRIPEFSLSQRSTGLLDLLQSRTASEGGYDSDAKSIQTAMLKSREDTMRLSPTKAQTLPSPTFALRGIAVDRAPPSPDAKRSDGDDPPFHAQLDGLPPNLSKTLLTEVFPKAEDESPVQVLQRLNAEFVDGTFKIPDRTSSVAPTPTLSEMREPDPFMTLSPPLMSSSPLHMNETEFVGMLKRLGETVAIEKRQSLITNGTDPRASLISNLDPGLLDFIERYGESPGTNAAETTANVHINKANFSPDLGATESSKPTRSSLPARENTSNSFLTSLAESERSSVHLYNMRISQRLGSPSFVATSARPNTSYSTAARPGQGVTEGQLSFDKTSTTGHKARSIKVEHNRRPSDPQTRRLFEGDRIGARPLSVWRNGTSPPIPATDEKLKSPMSFEDASSFYWSGGEVGSSGISRHSTVKKNPNSIAIGGRSESISLPIRRGLDSLSLSDESAWFGRKSSQLKRGSEAGSIIDRSLKRNRSVSSPDGPTLQFRVSPAPPHRGILHPAEANEAMSIVSTGQAHEARKEKMTEISLEAIYDARNEQMTEDSAQAIRDARNERLSEIGPLEQCYGTVGRPELVAFWSDARPSTIAPRLFEHARRSVSDNTEEAASTLSSKPNVRDASTNVWQKSFKQALAASPNESLGGFLTAPKFDREGRRRSTRSSFSVVELPRGHRCSDADTNPHDPGVQIDSPCLKHKSLLEICARKPEPLPSVNPRRDIASVGAQKNTFSSFGPTILPRKRSLLDIGRRFSVTGNPSEAERASDTSTPLKELLGIWGRFPSHTREDRCQSAGAKDGIAVRDFAAECQDENTPVRSARHTRSNTALGVHTSVSWKTLSFGKKSRKGKRGTKTANPLQTVQTAKSQRLRQKKSKKGIPARWKQLYRTRSMEFQAYTHNHSHRSSISVGGRVESPELEVVSGRASRRLSFDGMNEKARNHQQEAEEHAKSLSDQPLDSAPWTQTYRDCVGSLSALKSDPELRRASIEEQSGLNRSDTLGGMSSEELRDSTVDFLSQLGKENETAKEGLIRKVESMNPVQA